MRAASSYSARGAELNVTPPPIPYSASPDSASMTTVRMPTLNDAPGGGTPLGATKPIAPVYTPRGSVSRSRITCITRTFGAPVTDPLGNKPQTGRRAELPDRRRRPPWLSSARPVVTLDRHQVATATVPKSATRPRSLRMRSTMIRFPRGPPPEVSRTRRRAMSSAGQRPRRVVPFMVERHQPVSHPQAPDGDRRTARGEALTIRYRPVLR